MPNSNSFHEPGDWGTVELGRAQSESVSITFDQAISNPRIAVAGEGFVKVYEEGNGITVSGDRLSIVWDINGSEFQRFVTKTLNVQCSFYEAGRIEYIMRLKIIDTYV